MSLSAGTECGHYFRLIEFRLRCLCIGPLLLDMAKVEDGVGDRRDIGVNTLQIAQDT